MSRILIKMRAAAALIAIGVILSLIWPQSASATTQMTATVGVKYPFWSQHQVRHPRRPLSGADHHRHQQLRPLDQDQIRRVDRVRRHQIPHQGRGTPGTQEDWRAGAVKITTTALNLRTGPGLSYRVIKVLKERTKVTMTGKTARGWAQLVNGKSTGWSSMQHLASATSGRPAIIGKRMATADLDIRTTSGANSKTVAEVKKGTALSVTGAIQDDRAQIIYKGAIRWVTARHLTKLASNLPSLPKLPKITGTRFATSELNIRSTYSDKYRLITVVPRGTRLGITGVVKNGRMQIICEKAARWVTAKYLSKSAPESIPPSWRAVERGLKPNAIKVHRAARAKFPQITTYYTVRPGVFDTSSVPSPNLTMKHELSLELRARFRTPPEEALQPWRPSCLSMALATSAGIGI
jgi:uncharacterized protein YgiM (DUF1202 family)